MTIDRDLYNKYSGRTGGGAGDPHTRLGESLAKRDARRARLEEARDAMESSDGDGPLILVSEESEKKLWIILALVGIAVAAAAVVRFFG